MLKKLKSLIGVPEVIHTQYLHPIDVNIVKSKKEFVDCVNLHAFPKEHVQGLEEGEYYTRLDYDKNGLVAAYECTIGDENVKEQIPSFLRGYPYFAPTLHQPMKLMKSDGPTGFSLGGKPSGLRLPYLPDLATPFQHIATIQRTFSGMEWLPFEQLRIVYPLLSSIENYLFLDYTRPEEPRVLEDYLKFHPETYYGPLPDSGIIEYELTHLRREKPGQEETMNYFQQFAHIGIPGWQQDFVLPYCPISGNLMRFVCGISCYNSVPLKQTNVDFKDEYKNNTIAHLNFWGDGTLLVFMAPETKIVGMIIQNS